MFSVFNYLMEDEKYVRPERTMEEMVAEVPEEVLPGDCEDVEPEELIFTPKDYRQSEDLVGKLMEACPNLSLEQALNYLNEFKLPEAIRLAKKLSPQVLIPSWTVPGLNQVTIVMGSTDVAKYKVVRTERTGALNAVLSSRVYELTEASIKSDSVDDFILRRDERRYVEAPANYARKEEEEEDDELDSENVEAVTQMPAPPKRKVGRPKKNQSLNRTPTGTQISTPFKRSVGRPKKNQSLNRIPTGTQKSTPSKRSVGRPRGSKTKKTAQNKKSESSLKSKKKSTATMKKEKKALATQKKEK